jgi:hypothetical protein
VSQSPRVAALARGREVAIRIRSWLVRWGLVLSLAPGLTGCGLVVAALVVGVGVAIHEVQKKNGKALFVVRNPDSDVPILGLALVAAGDPEAEPQELYAFVPPGSHLVDADWDGVEGVYDVVARWADGRTGVVAGVPMTRDPADPVRLDFCAPTAP